MLSSTTKSSSSCPSLCGGRKMGLSEVRSRRIRSQVNFASSRSFMEKANRSVLALSIASTLSWSYSCKLSPILNLDFASLSRCGGPRTLPPSAVGGRDVGVLAASEARSAKMTWPAATRTVVFVD